MPEYDFTLKFNLQDSNINPEIYIDKLYESGCDDAIIGTGKKGYISLNFIRESSSAYEAISSAIENIKKVIPQAVMINVAPDFVGVTDIANLLGCSRQNVRKLILKDNLNSPPAVYEGAQSIWHLADVLTWLVEDKAYFIDESLIKTAAIAKNLNIAKQYKMLDPDLQENFKTLVA